MIGLGAWRRSRIRFGLFPAVLLVATGCTHTSPKQSQQGLAQIERGGDLVIARTADSTSMDATSKVNNESIWVFEQIFETLYEVRPDGKG